MWGATTVYHDRPRRSAVSTHAPRVGRDHGLVEPDRLLDVSTHAPRVGRDFFAETVPPRRALFQPTRPVWGATIGSFLLRPPFPMFQPTRPVWGATTPHGRRRRPRRGFNPRAPCGARQQLRRVCTPALWFQPTRPVWGATGSSMDRLCLTSGFNPRAPCGARPCCARRPAQAPPVSTHAPRVGRDLIISFSQQFPGVSTHAPRVGRDGRTGGRGTGNGGFNPRAPCGARRIDERTSPPQTEFQPTRPVWGATSWAWRSA